VLMSEYPWQIGPFRSEQPIQQRILASLPKGGFPFFSEGQRRRGVAMSRPNAQCLINPTKLYNRRSFRT